MHPTVRWVAAVGGALVVTSAMAAAPVPGNIRANAVGEEGGDRPEFARYQATAFPSDSIGLAETREARRAWSAVGAAGTGDGGSWEMVSPSTNPVPGLVTYTGRPTKVSGRVTALALSPGCGATGQGPCRLWMGAAGGGVWRAENPFGETVQWTLASTGIASSAIGSLAADPNGRGRVVYVGTGEQNASGDSEAGVGLYRSTDGGESWRVIPASVPLAEGLSIASIAIDPRDSRHFYFGTATGIHGAGASGGGALPPGTAPLGLYETRDGGATFKTLLSFPGFAFTLGVMQIALDPVDLDTVYVALFSAGVFRSSPALDGDAAFRQVFATGEPNDGFNRTTFGLARLGGTTRIYVGDPVDLTFETFLYRVDDSRRPAAALFDGVSNVGWIPLSDPTPGTPGFGSYDFCQEQCWYDIFVASPPGRPDEVWIGGAMGYDEIFTSTPPSNGRAVMRSTDAGVHFTDMTRDARLPAEGMHPDQHAIVFNPRNPAVAVVGSDGGVVRTDGRYVDRSGDCGSRGLSGAALADCLQWLSSIPHRIDSLNDGLSTLQFQSVSLNPQDPGGEWMGGTQDNGTWAFREEGDSWFESIGGDGGQSGFDAVDPKVRVHTYYGPSTDVTFRGSMITGWNWVADPLWGSGEAWAFYVPLIADPVAGGSIFMGMQHVWRTQDSGGPQAYLEQHCNEYTGDFLAPCGDWQPLGDDLTGKAFGTDNRGGRWVVSVERSRGDRSTLWAATFRGRVFVSRNADDPNSAAVVFRRIDSPATPRRVVSGVAIDPSDGTHAWVSYTGYGVNTPATPGHVYEYRVPGSGPATVVDLSYNLGDLPITALVRDDATGNLYAGTDFGVLRLAAGDNRWTVAGEGLPIVAVYHLTLSGRVLDAATHGRSVWRLEL